jgi:hypothetical protein
VIAGLGHKAPSDKLNIAGVGVGGMGRGNLRNMKSENTGLTQTGVSRIFRMPKSFGTGEKCTTKWVNQLMRLWWQQPIIRTELLLPTP